MLEAAGLSGGYGQVPVVHDVDLAVTAGEVAALIGPNGAGKSTTLRTLAGELPALGGTVLYRGTPTTEPLHKRCRQGLGYLTEERSVFMGMSTRDNIRAAGVSTDAVLAVFPELEPKLSTAAGLLSGGQQQMLSLGRVLARKPQVLLADELSLGLAPIIVRRLLAALRSAADQGMGILLVEQHVRQALTVADSAHVMVRGRIVQSGSAQSMLESIDDIEALYLGMATDPSAQQAGAEPS